MLWQYCTGAITVHVQRKDDNLALLPVVWSNGIIIITWFWWCYLMHKKMNVLAVAPPTNIEHQYRTTSSHRFWCLQLWQSSQVVHYAAVLHICRYIKGTLFRGLFYSTQYPLVVCAFSDSDWAGNPTDRSWLLLSSWRSKKQTFVSRSSTEVEYHALVYTTSELIWLRWLLKDLGVSTFSPTPL